MKYLFLILPFILLSCDNGPQKTQQQNKKSIPEQVSEKGLYGEALSSGQPKEATQLPVLLAGVSSKKLKLYGKITSSCQMTGCWMNLDIGNHETVHITFKDEAFEIPLDAAGKMATVEGIATKEMIPVDYLKRQAKSEGKTQAEIDAITEPLTEYAFIASGVIIEE